MCIPTNSSVNQRKLARWVAVASVCVALGGVLFVSGCEWMGGPATSHACPDILLDRLAAAGTALRKADVIDMEGTAGLRSGQRASYQIKLQNLADNYSRKYRDDLIHLALLPQREVDEALAARLKTGGDAENSKLIAFTIELHLRMARAKMSPSNFEIIRDYSSLRYLTTTIMNDTTHDGSHLAEFSIAKHQE